MRFDSTSCTVVVSVLPESVEDCLRTVGELPEETEGGGLLVEIRADLLTSDELDRSIREIRRPLLLAIRRPQDSGLFAGAEQDRAALLRAALNHDHVTIDVEWNSELRNLAAESPERRIVSLHGGACDASRLRREFRKMVEEPAAAYKRVPEAGSLADNLAIRELLTEVRRDSLPPLAAFAMGRAGRISRILAGSWGSWASYGAVDRHAATAPGQGTYLDLIDIYRVRSLGEATKIFGLVGADLSVSPSPAMHRFGYSHHGFDAVYLPFECDRFEEFVALLDEGFELDGFGVTAPFKAEAASRCRSLDGTAGAAQSVNTVTLDGDDWVGTNTDAPAAADAVERFRPLRDARALVLGAGGTGAAVAAAFRDRGAEVTVSNRSPERAAKIAEELGIEVLDWNRRSEAACAQGGWDLLVQTTSLGRNGERVLDDVREILHPQSVVLDFVYGPTATPLIESARRIGCRVIDGADLLGGQAVGQFQALTGLPVDRASLVEISRSHLAALA